MRRLPLPALVVALAGAGPAGPPAPDGPPDATVDLTTSDGVSLLAAEWRYGDARLVEAEFRAPGPDNKPSGPPIRTLDLDPHASAAGIDDSSWPVIEPESLSARRSTGKVCFNWYRIGLTIPRAVGDFDIAGSTAVFEIVVDDYAEVWVNGRLNPRLGQAGGSLVGGFNVPNRVVAGRHVRPGDRIQIAVFGINGPISSAPQNYIWVRSARLDFYRPKPPPPPRPLALERLDPRFDELIPPDARLVTIADGFTWVEGPAWDRRSGCLYFSDIPANAAWRFRPGEGVSLLLHPSGYTSDAPFLGREPGSNGITLDAQGRIILCQHGDRRLARLEPNGSTTVLADRYQGRRLNSPNDAVYDSTGALYFTDPPFGLPGAFLDPAQELGFCGVYRLSPAGDLTLLVRDLGGPNGLALSPDERTLYVSNAQPERPVVMAYDLSPGGTVSGGRVLFDASRYIGARPGAPDGMKVDAAGRIFLGGPGGVYVLTPDGTHLGTILLGVPTANCTFGGDGSTLYVTADTSIYAIELNTRGAGFMP